MDGEQVNQIAQKELIHKMYNSSLKYRKVDLRPWIEILAISVPLKLNHTVNNNSMYSRFLLLLLLVRTSCAIGT